MPDLPVQPVLPVLTVLPVLLVVLILLVLIFLLVNLTIIPILAFCMRPVRSFLPSLFFNHQLIDRAYRFIGTKIHLKILK